MMNRRRRNNATGTPWQPAPELPGMERAERLRQEMESQLWMARVSR